MLGLPTGPEEPTGFQNGYYHQHDEQGRPQPGQARGIEVRRQGRPADEAEVQETAKKQVR